MVLTEEDEMIIASCLIIIAVAVQNLERPQLMRRCWTRPWIQRRKMFGAHHALVEELRNEDAKGLRNFLRMDLQTFEELLQMVTPLIKKKDTHMRDSIPPAESLSLTLRFLATGESYQSLEYLYRVPKTTLSYIIPETCDAIYRALRENYLKAPSSTEEWIKIAKEFEDKWHFPNCIGAMDGKHITIRCPVGSGSKYFNYKGFYSVVLLAVVDANYNFTYVDIGTNGRVSDGGIFARSVLFEKLEKKELSIPPPTPLKGRQDPMPFVLVGDEAFPLKPYLLKPYPARLLDMSRRIFNYRLSRARRIVENAFGILSRRFAVFSRPIALEPEKVQAIVLAACTLHNFLRSRSSATELYMPDGSVDKEDDQTHAVVEGDWRNNPSPNHNFVHLSMQGGNRSGADLRAIRDEFTEYFNSNGQVPWQWELI